ncbi:CcmB family protein [uncultured delta proteobacterium]|uniref:CcmB family protein n=1 Tax=uncultured delta proteobacterium TaxID=34034 RepID=A0A212J9V6_9DELT|nr:CcmB family protein [uncultured delta proteobacterium]
MLNAALVIAAKDMKLMAGRGGPVLRPLLLGLLLVTLFSLSLGAGANITAETASAVFWLSSAFCLTILMTALFDLEETGKARMGLLLAPIPVQAVWLGKSLAGLGLMLLIQTVLLAASLILCNMTWAGSVPLALGGVILVDIGIVGLGALLASLTGGQTARESLCSLVVFPLLVPQLLAGIRLLAALYDAAATDAAQWLGITAAFDAIFIAAALVLFPVLFGGEN